MCEQKWHDCIAMDPKNKKWKDEECVIIRKQCGRWVTRDQLTGNEEKYEFFKGIFGDKKPNGRRRTWRRDVSVGGEELVGRRWEA